MWRKIYIIWKVHFYLLDKKSTMNRLKPWFFRIYDFHHKHVIISTNNMKNIEKRDGTCLSWHQLNLLMVKTNPDVIWIHHLKINLNFSQQSILNINCDKIVEQLDDSKDEFSTKFQNITIVQVIQIFFEMFVCGRRKVLKQLYFEVTSIRENLQKDSYEFNELLHEVVSKELCISQNIILMILAKMKCVLLWNI